MREQKDRRGWLSLQKSHNKAVKSDPTKSSSHYQIKHPRLHWALPVMVYMCVWQGFNAPNQSSLYDNRSLALPKVEQRCCFRGARSSDPHFGHRLFCQQDLETIFIYPANKSCRETDAITKVSTLKGIFQKCQISI